MKNTKHLLTLGLLTAGVLGLGTAGTAMAQATGGATTGLEDTTTVEDDDSTDLEDDEDSTDDDEETTQSGPVTVSGSWVDSGTWPRFEHISCRQDDHEVSGSGVMHPGMTSAPFPGFPGYPGFPIYHDDVRCSVHSEYGLVYYDCRCGDDDLYPRGGNLEQNWFSIRPAYEDRLQACKALMREQCGNVSVPVKTSCSNDFGACEARAFVRDDEQKYTSLTVQCRCIDQSTWSSRQGVDGVVAPNAMQLNERCELEVARCGREGVGQGGSGLLGLARELRLDTTCATPFGNCFMKRNANGPDSLSCGCRGGERKVLSGDLGWSASSISEILGMCKNEIDTCKPAGHPELGVESGSTGGTGGSVATNSTSTGGANAAVVSAGKEPKVQCAMSGDSGRFGYAFLAGLALLGLRRRRS